MGQEISGLSVLLDQLAIVDEIDVALEPFAFLNEEVLLVDMHPTSLRMKPSFRTFPNHWILIRFFKYDAVFLKEFEQFVASKTCDAANHACDQ